MTIFVVLLPSTGQTSECICILLCAKVQFYAFCITIGKPIKYVIKIRIDSQISLEYKLIVSSYIYIF